MENNCKPGGQQPNKNWEIQSYGKPSREPRRRVIQGFPAKLKDIQANEDYLKNNLVNKKENKIDKIVEKVFNRSIDYL